jgi:hypothetical protein
MPFLLQRNSHLQFAPIVRLRNLLPMSTSQQQAGKAGGFSGDLSLRSAAFRMSGRLIMNDSEGSPGLQSLCTQDFAEAVLKHERA